MLFQNIIKIQMEIPQGVQKKSMTSTWGRGVLKWGKLK